MGYEVHKPCLNEISTISIALLFLFSLQTVEERCCGGSEEWDCVPWGLTKLGLETLLINYSCVRGANTHTHTHTHTSIYAHTILILIRRIAEHGNMSTPDSEARMSPYGISMESWFGVVPVYRGFYCKTTSLISTSLFQKGIAWHVEDLFSYIVLELNKS